MAGQDPEEVERTASHSPCPFDGPTFKAVALWTSAQSPVIYH